MWYDDEAGLNGVSDDASRCDTSRGMPRHGSLGQQSHQDAMVGQLVARALALYDSTTILWYRNGWLSLPCIVL